MKKLLKCLTALAVLGTIAGLLASYLHKTRVDIDLGSGHAADDEEFSSFEKGGQNASRR